MAPVPLARLSRLEGLSPDIICTVLTQLNELRALRCAILSCRTVLNAFNNFHSAIVVQVFCNELDSCGVRHEAVVALLASRLAQPANPLSTLEFVAAYLRRGSIEAGVGVAFGDVPVLYKIYRTISGLAEEFGITKLEELGETQSQLELSAPERRRIVRTLYLLEIFYNIFGRASMPDLELVMTQMRALDVYSGEAQIEPAKAFDRQPGLLVCGQTLTGRYLHRAWQDLSGMMCDEQAWAPDHTDHTDPQTYALKARRPYFEDVDDGPFKIWKWAHGRAMLGHPVHHSGRMKLHEMGYVMWDQARVDRM
ncbi:hypothetical protein F4777DRAFT_427146 [Nemania sp. FL0916]|nr:hypothetical protein F4777DRAFT_427146 [Nemania sp. FL0916]